MGGLVRNRTGFAKQWQGRHSLQFFGNAPIFDDPSDEPTDFYRGESVRNFFLYLR